jgi:rhamnose transport system substrate-binding protein
MGCKPDEQPDNNSAVNNNSAVPTTKKIQIVFIPKNVGNPYFEGIDKGMAAACKELGADYSMTGPAQAEATSQIQYIKDKVQNGANVICIAANSVDALNITLDEVRAKGVKIVTVDSDLTGNESHRDIGIFATDFDKLGAALLDEMGKSIGYDGKIAILSATTDAPNQNAWIVGMKEQLKDAKYAKMPLVSVVYGDDKPEKSATEMEGLLTKYPDLSGVIAPTTVGVAAAAKVAQLRGVYPGGRSAKGKGVTVFGLGTPKQMSQFIKDGVTPKIALWSPVDMGTVAAHVCVALAKGELKAEMGQKITAGKLGSFEVGEKNKVIIGPPVIFTKDNVDQYPF